MLMFSCIRRLKILFLMGDEAARSTSVTVHLIVQSLSESQQLASCKVMMEVNVSFVVF